MDWILLLVAVLLVLGVAIMLFARHHGTTGGVTRRSMRGRAETGAQGPSVDSDREGFRRHAGQHGTR